MGEFVAYFLQGRVMLRKNKGNALYYLREQYIYSELLVTLHRTIIPSDSDALL